MRINIRERVKPIKVTFTKRIKRFIDYTDIPVGYFFINDGHDIPDSQRILYQKISNEVFLNYTEEVTLFYYKSCGEDWGNNLLLVDVNIEVLE